MDLSVVNKDFLFNAVPPVVSNIYIPFSIFFGILLLSGLLLLIFLKGENRMIWGRYITPFLLTGVLGFIYLGSRYEQLPWIAARIVLVLILTIFFAWIFAIAFSITKLMPEYNKTKEQSERYKKYLPGKSQKSKVKSQN